MVLTHVYCVLVLVRSKQTRTSRSQNQRVLWYSSSEVEMHFLVPVVYVSEHSTVFVYSTDLSLVSIVGHGFVSGPALQTSTVSVYIVYSTDLSPVSPVGRGVVSGPRCSSFCRVLLQPTTRKEYGIDYWQPSSQVDVCVVCAAMFTCGERMCVCVCVCVCVTCVCVCSYVCVCGIHTVPVKM